MEEYKNCKNCKKDKLLSEYYTRSKSKKPYPICKKCNYLLYGSSTLYKNQSEGAKEKIRARVREKYKNDHNGVKTKRKEYAWRYSTEHPEIAIFNNAKARAKQLNIDFDLVKEDIIVPTICPILGIPIQIKTGIKNNDRLCPSLDRIDTNRGYVRGNIAVISNMANTMKNNATFEQLRSFAKNIIPYIDGASVSISDHWKK